MNKTLEKRVCDYIEKMEFAISEEFGGGETWQEILNGVLDLDVNFDRYKDGVKLHMDAKDRDVHNGEATEDGSGMSEVLKDGALMYVASHDAAGIAQMIEQLRLLRDAETPIYEITPTSDGGCTFHDLIANEILRLTALIK